MLGQGIGGLGRVALGRVFPQQTAEDLHATGELPLALQESGHARVAEEAALDRRPQNQVAPLVLAQLMVGRRDLHDLVERHFQVGPLLLDDLDVVDDFGRRPQRQMNVQEHEHRFPIDERGKVPVRRQLGQSLARRTQLAAGEIALAQREQLGGRQPIRVGALAPAGRTVSAAGAATAN